MRRFAGLAVAGCFMVAACGSTTSAESDGGGETAAEYVSPLNDFLGIDYSNNNDDQQAEFDEQQRQINESVIGCMSAEGFEWVPDDQNMVSFDGGVGANDGLEYGSRGWIEKYGFGISTQMFQQSQLGPDLVGYDDSQFTDQEYVDPNGAYLEGLSEADQVAFNEALYGRDDGPQYDESLTEEEMNQLYDDFYNSPDYKPTGCYNIASEEVYSGGGEYAIYEVFSDELNAMYERIQADPRIQAAEAKVAECMSGKGFSFTTMDAVYEDFNSRAQPLWDQMPDPAADLSEQELAEMTDADWQALYENPPPLSDEVKATIAEMQKEEVGMAIALDDCGGGYSNQDSIYNEIRIELEQEFIDTHREELEKLKSEN